MPPRLSRVVEKLQRVSRTRRVRWAALLGVVPFMGGVAAFGIAPATVTEPPPMVSRVVEEVELAPVVSAAAADEGYWREEKIQKGDTVAALLARLRVDDAAALRFLTGSHEARGVRRLLPGHTVSAHTAADGRLLELRYATGLMVITVRPFDGSFRISQEVAPLERRIMVRSAEITGGSLYAAIDAAHLDDTIAGQLADIFATDIDFHRELRSGDRFTVIYEMYYAGGEPIKWGRVIAAEFVNSGVSRQAIWFQHANGQGAYYTPEGHSVHKAFLRSPLEYSRITSGFAAARFHPILQLWRAHKGIDYAAAAGTAVKATADGVVENIGRDRGYGNFVVLRHEQKYTTLYGHLSGFGVGIKRGARVSQGQAIGYVGSTGLATGPHLHYEFRVNEMHEDPLTVAMPAAPPITPDLKPMFDTVARQLVHRLTLLRGINVAQR